MRNKKVDSTEPLQATVLKDKPRFDPFTGTDLEADEVRERSYGAKAGLEAPRSCQLRRCRTAVQARPDGQAAKCSCHGEVDSVMLEQRQKALIMLVRRSGMLVLDVRREVSQPTMTIKGARVPHVEKQSVAMASGIVLFSVVTGAIAGVARTLLCPKQQVQMPPDNQLAVIQEIIDVDFIGLLWSAAVTAISGLVLGITTFRNHVITTPVQTLTATSWANFSALMSAAVAYLAGQSVAALLQLDLAGAQPDDKLSVIPDFKTCVALLVASLVAMLALWSRVLLRTDFTEGSGGATGSVTDADSVTK